MTNIIKYCNDGGIGAYEGNSSKAFIQTYAEQEVAIHLLGADGITTIQYIRIRLGINDKEQLIVLDNGKFYLVDSYATIVRPENQISPVYIFEAIKQIKNLQNTCGSILDLKTNNKASIVEAINELSVKLASPRTLKGYIEFVCDNIEPEHIKDLDIRFNNLLQKFEYYSEVSDEWIGLPDGWQKLKYIVRNRDMLPAEPTNEAYGILSEDKIVQYIDNTWTEVQVLDDMVGDEYIVRYVYDKYYTGNVGGSIIKTPKGWVYIVNYLYL